MAALEGGRRLGVGPGRKGGSAHPLVTLGAAADIKRIIACKRPSSVVALEAIASRRGQMLQHADIADLA